MSPMPMQTKIGDASLKFGPDWLRALSSDSGSGGGVTGGGGGGGWSSGSGGGGGSDRDRFRDYQPHHASHSHQSHMKGRERGDEPYIRERDHTREPKGSASPEHPSFRFKAAEFRYTREEMLALYDKNLSTPSYLSSFGTLFVEKMQPPLAFSQPSEEEIRIWHIPQPESSRQGGSTGPPPSGRGGYSVRGRGGGIERGRGRGRGGVGPGSGGGYYGRPHEEEDRSFTRPRTFERSQSAHERASWTERNGAMGGPGPSPPEEGTRGASGGSWRTRESFGGRRHEEDEAGWRKTRWRRDEEEENSRTQGSGRRLHKSWSEDGNNDNLPEWAKDNPCEESGTFDSTGAFHGEDRHGTSASKSHSYDGRTGGKLRDKNESEPHGSQIDRVQKRTPERNESKKAVIPPSVKEESEHEVSSNDHTKERYSATVTSSSTAYRNSDDHHHPDQYKNHSKSDVSHNQLRNDGGSQADQFQKLASKIISGPTHSGKMRQEDSIELCSSTNSHNLSGHHKPVEDDQFLCMTEADNLVAKLVEEDASMRVRASNKEIPSMNLGSHSHAHPIQTQHQAKSPSMNPIVSNSSNLSGGGGIHPPSHMGLPPPGEIKWLYRDPQGNVQGPFESHEMAQWYSQGYFAGTLLLRRDCDKNFTTLSDMAILYGRNPFVDHPEAGVPPSPHEQQQFPIQHPSALENEDSNFNESNPELIQHQIQKQHEQFLLNCMNQGGIPSHSQEKEESGWSNHGIQHPSQPSSQVVQQQQGPGRPGGPMGALTHEQMALLNFAKAQGLNINNLDHPNPIEHLSSLFQRQAQLKNQEILHKNPSSKNDFSSSILNQMSASHEVRKSPNPSSDPIQSLVQQLTNMSQLQEQQQQRQQMKHTVVPVNKMENQWGASPPSSMVNHQQQILMNSSMNSAAPHPQSTWMGPSVSMDWQYREHIMKMQQHKMQEEENLRRRKEVEEDRKRFNDEEERKRLEAEDKEKKRILEEQFLQQQKQKEAILQQQKKAAAHQLEMRQKEILLQQQQQQQRLQFEQQQRIEQQQRQEQQQRHEEQQRIEAQMKLEAQQRQEAEQRQQAEAQKRQQEMQRLHQEQQRREELQRREQEEQQRLQEQQLFNWQQQSQQASQLPQRPPQTILEIQEEEARKQQEEEHRQQSMKKKQQLQEQQRQREQQQQSKAAGLSLKWAQSAAAQQQNVPIKSLKEIQAEEQAKLANIQEKEKADRAKIQLHNQQQQAWSSHLTWANRASLNAPNPSTKTNGGIWDEPKSQPSAKATGPPQNPQNSNPFPNTNYQSSSKTTGKGKKEGEDFIKLLHDQQQGKGKSAAQTQPQDEFTRWCFETVENIGGGGVDTPTFVNFLKEVESPFEVGDYVRSYLGEGRDSKEFAKEFLERRSRWKSACRKGKDEGGTFEDNLCRPAFAVNPSQNDFQEVKAKGKKGKKGKMQKVDSRILGFNVTSAPDRVNVGKRDYGDGND